MTKLQELKVHEILYKHCSDFLNVQEITHAANEIIKNPTEETILEMTTYLDSFDTYRLGQPTLHPTTTTQGLTSNSVRFAMSELRSYLQQIGGETVDPEPVTPDPEPVTPDPDPVNPDPVVPDPDPEQEDPTPKPSSVTKSFSINNVITLNDNTMESYSSSRVIDISSLVADIPEGYEAKTVVIKGTWLDENGNTPGKGMSNDGMTIAIINSNNLSEYGKVPMKGNPLPEEGLEINITTAFDKDTENVAIGTKSNGDYSAYGAAFTLTVTEVTITCGE